MDFNGSRTLEDFFLKDNNQDTYVFPDGREVHCFYRNENVETDLLIEIEILSFNKKVKQQQIKFSGFHHKFVFEDGEFQKLVIDVNKKNMNRKFNFLHKIVINKKRKKILPQLTIANSWVSDQPNASFNLGETRHSTSRNSGIIIEEIEPYTYIFRFNSGAHDIDKEPLFDDIVAKIMMKPINDII